MPTVLAAAAASAATAPHGLTQWGGGAPVKNSYSAVMSSTVPALLPGCCPPAIQRQCLATNRSGGTGAPLRHPKENSKKLCQRGWLTPQWRIRRQEQGGACPGHRHQPTNQPQRLCCLLLGPLQSAAFSLASCLQAMNCPAWLTPRSCPALFRCHD